MKTLLTGIALLLAFGFAFADHGTQRDASKAINQCDNHEAFMRNKDVIAVKQLCIGITSKGAVGEEWRLVFLDKDFRLLGATLVPVLLD